MLLKEKWRHVGFHLISDVPGDDLESVMEEPSFGFALTTMKHDRKGLLDGGFDIGFQPIGGFDTTITVNDNGTVRDGTLYVRNQLAHASYLLRMTMFQNSGFQPFVEGYAGVRGSFLGARLVLEDGEESTKINDIPYFSSNFNYGYAAGLRLRVGKRSFVTARYARMLHLDGGDVVQVADPSGISIDETGAVTSSSTVGERCRRIPCGLVWPSTSEGQNPQWVRIASTGGRLAAWRAGAMPATNPDVTATPSANITRLGAMCSVKPKSVALMPQIRS